MWSVTFSTCRFYDVSCITHKLHLFPSAQGGHVTILSLVPAACWPSVFFSSFYSVHLLVISFRVFSLLRCVFELVFWHWVCDDLTVVIVFNIFTVLGLTQKGLDVVLIYISVDSACHLLLKFSLFMFRCQVGFGIRQPQCHSCADILSLHWV